MAALCALGLLCGTVNGIFGSGGGVAIILFLWSLAGDRLREKEKVFANVTAIILPISLASSFVYMKSTSVEAFEYVMTALFGAVGGLSGALLIGRVKPKLLKKIFAAVLLVSGAIMIFR